MAAGGIHDCRRNSWLPAEFLDFGRIPCRNTRGNQKYWIRPRRQLCFDNHLLRQTCVLGARSDTRSEEGGAQGLKDI